MGAVGDVAYAGHRRGDLDEGEHLVGAARARERDAPDLRAHLDPRFARLRRAAQRRAHTRTQTTCGISRSRCVAPQPRMIAPPFPAMPKISSAVKIDRLVLSAVRRSSSPALPSSKRITWLLRTRMRSARWSITSW